MRVGSLYARIPSLTHYGLVLVSRSVSTWEICQDHFAQCTLRDRLQDSQGSDGMSRIGPPSLSRSMVRQPQTLCRVQATSLRVSHDRPSSCLQQPIPLVQSCDTAGRSHGGVRAPMSSSWAKTNDIKGWELHLPQDITPPLVEKKRVMVRQRKRVIRRPGVRKRRQCGGILPLLPLAIPGLIEAGKAAALGGVGAAAVYGVKNVRGRTVLVRFVR